MDQKLITPQNQSRTFLNKEEEELFANLKDYKWRLNNLYWIKDKKGEKVLFKLNWAQQVILDNFWFFSIILKARQLGVTTFFCIFYLDQVLFSENKTAGIIAHRKEDAQRFFDDKVKYAWDNLPEILRSYMGPPNTDSANELSFPNGSKIFVSTSTRSGTVQFLHISELGPLSAKYPAKAEEIVSGAMNSVEAGQIITIESTASGKQGKFFEFCESAQQLKKMGIVLSPLDFKFFFFPWWKEPNYRLKGKYVLTQRYKDYFKNLKQKYSISLDDEQQHWYIKKADVNKDSMFSEYPSTPEEAFQATIKGAYYAGEMGKVFEEHRILPVPYDMRFPVCTAWDLGMNDTNSIIFFQAINNQIRIIDYYGNSGEGLAHYYKVMQNKAYVYDFHLLPHDIEVAELGSGQVRKKTLTDLGMQNIRTVKRTPNILDGIEAVRKLFNRFYFDNARTEKLTNALSGYRKEWSDVLGDFSNTPKHDKNSHPADAIRCLAEGWKELYENSEHDGDATNKPKEEQNFF